MTAHAVSAGEGAAAWLWHWRQFAVLLAGLGIVGTFSRQSESPGHVRRVTSPEKKLLPRLAAPRPPSFLPSPSSSMEDRSRRRPWPIPLPA